MLRVLIRYFFQGLIYTVPIAIIIYVLYKLFTTIGEVFYDSGLSLHPLIDPLLGLISVVLVVITIVALGSTILFRPMFSCIDVKLEKTPVIKTFYTSLKDVMKAFIGS